MATISAVNTSPLPIEGVGRYDRVFYSAMATVMALAVFAGFARTYYLPLLSGGPTMTIARLPFAPVVHIHGALFTTWVLLFIVQTTLVAQRHIAAHRRIGIAGAILAAAMVISGVAIRAWEARLLRGQSITANLSTLALGLSDILMFATFVATAIALRRHAQTHKRLMLLAYVSLLNAPIARIPGIPNRYAVVALTLLPLLAGIFYDLLSRGRVHMVYLVGGTLFALYFGTLLFH